MSLTLAAIPEIERKNDQHKMSTERYTRAPANGFARLSCPPHRREPSHCSEVRQNVRDAGWH